MDVHSLLGGMDNRKVSVVLKRRVRDSGITLAGTEMERERAGRG